MLWVLIRYWEEIIWAVQKYLPSPYTLLSVLPSAISSFTESVLAISFSKLTGQKSGETCLLTCHISLCTPFPSSPLCPPTPLNSFLNFHLSPAALCSVAYMTFLLSCCTHSCSVTLSKGSPPNFLCAGEEKTVCQVFRGGVTLAHAVLVLKRMCACERTSVYWGIPLEGRSCHCVCMCVGLGGREGRVFVSTVLSVTHEFQIPQQHSSLLSSLCLWWWHENIWSPLLAVPHTQREYI